MSNTNSSTHTPKPRRTLVGHERTKALPDGVLACRSCGVAVKNTDPKRVLTLRPMRVLSGNPPMVMSARPGTEIVLSLCDECAERRALAESIVAKHRLGPVYGDPAVDLLDAALCALDVLRLRGAKAAHFAGTRADARGLIENLAHVGSASTWAAKFAPILTGAHQHECAPRRWAHMTAEAEHLVFGAFHAMLRRQLEVAAPFAPPSVEGALRGCGLCGIGTLRVKESEADEAWGTSHQVNPGVLGGRSRPDPIRVHLCPTCRAMTAEAGAIGMGAVERALLRHVGYKTVPGWRLNFRDLRAWAALKPGTPPNSTPWAHIDTEGMKASLARTLGARPLRPQELR